MHPIVEELGSLIRKNGWQDAIGLAIRNAQASQLPGLEGMRGADDLLKYADQLVTWSPRVPRDPRHTFDLPIQLFFILDQEPLKSLQSPIQPAAAAEQLTPLSAWMVEFARAWGSYLDTTESAKGVESFKTDPGMALDEYMPPPSGYKTFNQFFGRHVKPGMRPIADLGDDRVLVAPADSTFVGQWEITGSSEIDAEAEKLDLKGLKWSIHQLLQGSTYADRFKGGVFAHAYLGVSDYHRWHTPVQGKVLEARVIQGQVYMDVRVKSELADGKEDKIADVVDGTGYQFVQTRGLLVIDSPIGLVGCLPIGMALVSSVIITAEVGSSLHKGEEMGYFQFGGSDFVMVFEQASHVQLTWQPGEHHKQGSRIGSARPRA